MFVAPATEGGVLSETVSTSTHPDEFTDTELGAWRGLLRVYWSLFRALDAEMEAKHGLPLTSYEVLIHLADAPEGKMRMRDLAEAALLSRSGLTRLVDRLERDGLIERASCPSDARGAYAVLTDKGRGLLAEARPAHRHGVRRRFLERFDEDELLQLGDFWERVLPGATGGEPSGPAC
jgi:DNA-binding MarR family transcriptional regulator